MKIHLTFDQIVTWCLILPFSDMYQCSQWANSAVHQWAHLSERAAGLFVRGRTIGRSWLQQQSSYIECFLGSRSFVLIIAIANMEKYWYFRCENIWCRQSFYYSVLCRSFNNYQHPTIILCMLLFWTLYKNLKQGCSLYTVISPFLKMKALKLFYSKIIVCTC